MHDRPKEDDPHFPDLHDGTTCAEASEKVFRWVKDEDHELTHCFSLANFPQPDEDARPSESMRYLYARAGEKAYIAEWPPQTDLELTLVTPEDLRSHVKTLLDPEPDLAAEFTVALIEGNDEEIHVDEEMRKSAEWINSSETGRGRDWKADFDPETAEWLDTPGIITK